MDDERDRLEQELRREREEFHGFDAVLRVVRPIMAVDSTLTLKQAAEALGYELLEEGGRLYLTPRT